jgi:hypothetical protein
MAWIHYPAEAIGMSSMGPVDPLDYPESDRSEYI